MDNREHDAAGPGPINTAGRDYQCKVFKNRKKMKYLLTSGGFDVY